ncbi:MAG: isoprenylcysteine carboxylmethyltransferase family protein [Nitrospirota bacterium]
MKKPISKIWLVAQFIIAIPVMMLVLFWPAGTLNWVEGWIYLVLQLGYASIMALYFLKHNPELIRKRMEMKIPPRLWDKIVMIPFIIGMIALIIVPGFDVVRYKWSSIPVYWEVIGFLGFIITSYLLFLVMKVNSYLLKTVEIQKDHKVVSTGPYAYVRHPMYSVAIIMVFSIALALGSLYALIPAAASSFALIIRTQFEDKTLQKELEGYTEYTKKVTYKLIPGIW